jgi:hypothetical protein
MAKRTCPNGHVTKDGKALKCSQCGADLPPLPKSRRKWPLILGILGALLLCGMVVTALGGGNGDKTQTASRQAAPAAEQQAARAPTATAEQDKAAEAEPPAATRTRAPTKTPLPTRTPVPLPVVGAEVKVGDITWKVLSAQNLGKLIKSNNQFIKDLKTSGSFVAVRYEVANAGTREVFYLTPDLLDESGRRFGSTSDAIFHIPEDEQCLLEQINPGITKTCQGIYEVPADAAHLVAELTGLKLFAGNTQVDLGLE